MAVKLAITVTDLDQLAAVLRFAKLQNLALDMGVFDDEPPPKQQSRKGRSTRKPKRYARNLPIKVSAISKLASPKMREAHQALLNRFGRAPFEKKLAKGVILSKGVTKYGASGYVTKLLDQGGLVPA